MSDMSRYGVHETSERPEIRRVVVIPLHSNGCSKMKKENWKPTDRLRHFPLTTINFANAKLDNGDPVPPITIWKVQRLWLWDEWMGWELPFMFITHQKWIDLPFEREEVK